MDAQGKQGNSGQAVGAGVSWRVAPGVADWATARGAKAENHVCRPPTIAGGDTFALPLQIEYLAFTSSGIGVARPVASVTSV